MRARVEKRSVLGWNKSKEQTSTKSSETDISFPKTTPKLINTGKIKELLNHIHKGWKQNMKNYKHQRQQKKFI